jgi:hypothetical protein
MERTYLKRLSTQDNRDYKLFRLVAAPPTQFPDEFILPYFGRVKDQGQIGSCVAHSLSEERESVEFYQYLFEKYNYTDFSTLLSDLAFGKLIPTTDDLTHYKEYSVGYIYGDRDVPKGEDPEGMDPREALKFLSVNGDVYEIDFPENDTYPVVRKLFLQRQADLISKGQPHKITAFARLTTIDEIKAALMTLGPVTIGIAVYPSFENISTNGVVPMPNPHYEQLLGYHEITVFGWRKDNHLKVLNSWSQNWGDHGFCWLPFDFTKMNDFEAWSMTDGLLPDNPQPQPQPVPSENFAVVLKKIFRKQSTAENYLLKILLADCKPVIIQMGKSFKIILKTFSNLKDATAFETNATKHGYNSTIIKQ